MGEKEVLADQLPWGVQLLHSPLKTHSNATHTAKAPSGSAVITGKRQKPHLLTLLNLFQTYLIMESTVEVTPTLHQPDAPV